MEIKERKRVLHNLKLSPHKALSNYKGKDLESPPEPSDESATITGTAGCRAQLGVAGKLDAVGLFMLL